MTKQKYFYLILIVSLALISGCMVYRTQPKKIECPRPEQDCFPGKWDGMEFDTSVEASKILGYYYVIETVKQINSPDDEWCFSFLSSKRAAMTFSDRDRQRMMIVRKIKPNRFTLESGIYLPKDGHTGALSVRNKQAIFASNATEEEVYKEGYDEEYEEQYRKAASLEKNVLTLYELPYYEIMGNSDLYSASYRDGNQFLEVESLGKDVNFDQDSWESHPALSPDGNVLFFASDRPGNWGGTDIWFAIKQPAGKWLAPINAGVAINTNCDELTPFVTNDGKKLLFASAGHKTVGGYDIFSADISDMFWSDAKNLNLKSLRKRADYFYNVKNIRPPLNTAADEIFPSTPVDPDSLLYYSSNQGAGRTSIVLRRGGFDMYVRYRLRSPFIAAEVVKPRKSVDIAFGDEPDLQPDIEQPQDAIIPFYNLYGTVYNAETKDPVPETEIIIRELPGAEVTKQTTTNAAGEYKVELDKDREFEITAQAKDLFFDSFKLRVEKDDPLTEVKKDIYLPLKMELRVNFPLDNYTDPYKYVLDSNGVETNKTWQKELDMLAANIFLSKDKLVKIKLAGNTDYLASVAYNVRLGQRRVDFVIKELVKRGVPRDLLEGRSAGELEPLPRRKGENEKIYRKRLRRVTLEKVLKSI